MPKEQQYHFFLIFLTRILTRNKIMERILNLDFYIYRYQSVLPSSVFIRIWPENDPCGLQHVAFSVKMNHMVYNMLLLV
jgi:hypothetical protein